MNTRTLCLAAWLLAASLGIAQTPSIPAPPSSTESWRQLIHQGPKAGADLEAAGDSLADTGHFADAAARYESWRDLPDATADQKALATIKLAQLADAQFELDRASDTYLKALPLIAPKSPLAHEIRLRIEDLQRRQGNLPRLTHVWEDYLKTHGDDAEAGLFLANALAELRRPEELPAWPHFRGNATPEKDTHDAARAAARQTANANKERQVLDSLFQSETDPLERLDMVKDLADASARSGQLNQLIADFQKKSRTEPDGWRYTVYLAEIQRSLHDTIGAQAELVRAYGLRSRDPLYLTEAWRIAVDWKNTAERVRLARLLANAAPNTPHEIELILALLGNGENAEALQGLRANEDAIVADPMAWHDTLLLAGAAGLGRTTTGLLESALAGHPGAWRFLFLLAESNLQLRDFATAEKCLRELEASRPPVVAAPAPAAPADKIADDDLAIFHSIDGITYDSGTGHSLARTFTRRNVQGAEARRLLRQIAASLDGVSASASQDFLTPAYARIMPEHPLPQTADEAADAALVIRSVLAQQEGRGAEFVTELRATLETLPRAERLARLSLVQALDPLLQELTTEANAPSGDPMTDATGLEILLSLGTSISPTVGSVDVDPATIIPLLENFLAREKHSDTVALGQMELSKLLKKNGRKKEATDLASRALVARAVQTAFDSQARLFDVLQFAFDEGDTAQAETIIQAMEDDAYKNRRAAPTSAFANDRLRLATIVAQQKPGDPRVANMLAAALRDTYTPPAPNLSLLFARRAQSVLWKAQKFPYNSRLTDMTSMMWSSIFDLAKKAGQVPALRAAIVQQVQELPPEQGWQARLAGISFAWWSEDRDTAIRDTLALAISCKDSDKDDLSLLAGSMLADAGRTDEARASFESVSATEGPVAIDKLSRLLALARTQKDTERAKALALQLADLPLNNLDELALPPILQELGLGERAQTFQAALRARGEVFSPRSAVERMRRVALTNSPREAVEIARGILARFSPASDAPLDRSPRYAALDTLRTAKALTEYTDDLNRQLAANPTSIDTLLRLAEAFERKEQAQAVPLYRRAVEAAPDNLSLQLRLARVLAATRQPAEAVRVWDSVLAKDPGKLLGDDFYSIFEVYKSSKQLDRLSAVLLKIPPRSTALDALVYALRDTSTYYEQVAEALEKDGEVAEALQIRQASLARARETKASPHVEAAILKPLLPALIAAGRRDEAAQEIENFFFPPPTPRAALGYETKSTRRKWTETTTESQSSGSFRTILLGDRILQMAAAAGALGRLQTKATAAAAEHPDDPERLLAIWIDALRRDPARLDAVRKDLDAVIDRLHSSSDGTRPPSAQAAGPVGVITLQTPWTATTIPVVHAIAESLAEWPEGRPLALHVYERTPSAYLLDGKVPLRRAEIALAIPEKETAVRALHDWLSWRASAPSLTNIQEVEDDLSASELMVRAGMLPEAKTLYEKFQNTNYANPTFKKRKEELGKLFAPPPAEKK